LFLKKPWSKFFLAALLIILSAAFFILQELLFDKPQEAGFLFFQDLAFLPLEVLLVTFLLEGLLSRREKREKSEQINILISAFFSEVGIDAIKILRSFIINSDGYANMVDIRQSWRDIDYKNAAKDILSYIFEADSTAYDLEKVNKLLYWKKDEILTMFQNPNLLENNRFTNMIFAVYHLMDELNNRDDFITLPQSDYDHLSGDIERAYKLLVVEWLYYMRHLKNKYPYLYSMAIRKNPFKDNDAIVVY